MDYLFEKVINIILNNEGGYCWHKDDPGGETKYGISARNFPNENIKNLTEDRAKELYYINYWVPLNLSGINNSELVLQIFDFAVNAGMNRAIKFVQEIAGVEVDGAMGPITKKAINEYKLDIVELYKHRRRKYYRELAKKRSEMKVFLKGWLKRIDNTHF